MIRLSFFRREFTDPVLERGAALVAEHVAHAVAQEPPVELTVTEPARFQEPIEIDPPLPQLLVSNRVEFRDRVERLMNQGARRFVVNCAHLEYVDPAAFGMLISLTKAVRAKGGDLHLVHVSPDLFTVITLAKLDAVLSVTPRPATHR